MYYLIDVKTGQVYAEGSSVFWLLKDLDKKREQIYRPGWRPPYYDRLIRVLLNPFALPPINWGDFKEVLSAITLYVIIVKAA